MAADDPLPPNSTLALVRGALAGEREALGALYQRHHDRVRRYAALKMGATLRRCEQDIEDVAQQAWTDAMDALLAGRFDPDHAPGAFRRWLATLVANRVRDSARKSARRGEVAGIESPSAILAQGQGQSTRLGLAEMLERVEEAMLALSEEEREALCMRHLCGMSSDEVRAEMGLERPEQARWVVARALRRLRDRLGKLADEWVEHYA